MTLDEVLAYIHKVDWRGSVPGLSRIDTLLGLLGHPERHVKYVHVTGTNGKGSTCAMLASVLRAAGYKTGLYTSPYIFRFNERMQINGAPIPDDTLCALVEELRPLADRMADPPTEFELVTAIGLTWFAREACDIVVCEVGMGGEFDATNVIPAPEAAVLTNIGLDHTKVLGNTVEAIAATKAGIIKPGCHAVLYPCAPSVQEVVAVRCRAAGAPLTVADFDALSLVSDTLEGQIFNYGPYKGLRLPLLGGHQLRNAAVALTTIDVLRQRGWHIDESAVRQGLAGTVSGGAAAAHDHSGRRAQPPVHGLAGGGHPGVPAGPAGNGADRCAGGQGLWKNVRPAGSAGRAVYHCNPPQSPCAGRRRAGGLPAAIWQAGNGLRHHPGGCVPNAGGHAARWHSRLLRLPVSAGRCGAVTGKGIKKRRLRRLFFYTCQPSTFSTRKA